MLCPSCSAAALDAYGRCPNCGYSAVPPPQPYASYYPQPSLVTPTAPAGIGLAAQILMAVSGLVAIVEFGVNLWAFGVAKNAFDTGVTTNDAGVAGAAAVLIMLAAVLSIATGVVFIIWFYKSAKLAEILAPGRQSLSSGWAIGGWFVPIAWLALPRIVAGGIWRAAVPLTSDPYAYARKPRTYLVTWWWLAFIVGQTLVLSSVVSIPGESASSTQFLAGAYGMSAFVDLCRAASAVLGIIMVRKLTSMQQVRILQGPGVGHPYAAPAALGVQYGMYADPAAQVYPGPAPAYGQVPVDAPYAPPMPQPMAQSAPVAPPQPAAQPLAPEHAAPMPYQASVPPQAAAPREEALPPTVVEAPAAAQTVEAAPTVEAPRAAEPQDAVPAEVPTAVIPRQAAEDHATVLLTLARSATTDEPQDAVPSAPTTTEPKEA